LPRSIAQKQLLDCSNAETDAAAVHSMFGFYALCIILDD